MWGQATDGQQVYELYNRLVWAETEIDRLKQLIVKHGANHEIGAGDVVRPAVYANGTLLTRRRAINFGSNLTATDDASNNWTNVAGAAGMLKTSGTGFFTIPTGPSVGTGVTSGAANTYGSYTQLIPSTSAALYVVGICIRNASSVQYAQIMLGTGGAGSETAVGEWKLFPTDATATAWGDVITLPFPIPVATATRIAAKTADNSGGSTHSVTLLCINQSGLVAI